eukprot:CAMPEP_0180137544 /NCGR_PEP_ID=MMETSP0986-20121125/12281_1 /TAXON_ID=697907 /ORGANISM="non described non described, Strain CCMP2293" /LENGTH=820 /DNA_ID=CAMNT_0022079037 /DNA_START=42 /DNA_END=2507 /DNA_ORIENTATION=+
MSRRSYSNMGARATAFGLLSLAHTCSAGLTGAYWGPQARDMQMTLTGGVSGAEIIAVLFGGGTPDITAVQGLCSEETPRLCRYVTFITGSVAMGLVVIPILATIAAAPSAAGAAAPSDADAAAKALRAAELLRALPDAGVQVVGVGPDDTSAVRLLFIMMAFSAGGLLSVTEIGDDLDKTLMEVSALALVPTTLIDKTKETVREVKGTAFATLDSANELLSGVSVVNASTRVLEGELDTLEAQIKQLMFVVEGCWPELGREANIAGKSCQGDYSTLPALHTPDGYSHARCSRTLRSNDQDYLVFNHREIYKDISSGGFGENPVGIACCTQCTKQLIPVLESISKLPSAAVFGDINKPFPVGELRGKIDENVGGYDTMFERMRDPLAELETTIETVKTSIPPSVFVAVASVIFAPTIVVCVFMLLGMCLGVFRATGKQGAYCMWFSYFLGSVVFIVLICPFWGIFTLTTVPLGDLCELLPTPGTPTQEFRTTLNLSAPEGFGPLFWKVLLDDCLLDETGYMWPAMGLTRKSFSEGMAAFNTSEMIPAPSLNTAQDTSRYTTNFKNNLTSGEFTQKKILFAIMGDYCRTSNTADETALADCPADTASKNWSDYYISVAGHALTIQQQAIVVRTAMERTELVSAEMKSNFTKLFASSDSQLASIIDGIWDIGTCKDVASGWEGLRGPMCDGVIGDLQAAWGGLFMCMFFMFFGLLTMCHGSKVLFQIRQGKYIEMEVYEEMENMGKVKAMSPEDETEYANVVVPPAAMPMSATDGADGAQAFAPGAVEPASRPTTQGWSGKSRAATAEAAAPPSEPLYPPVST